MSVFVLAIVVPGASGNTGTQSAGVYPILECVTAEKDGTYTAFFGYKNDGTASVTIPVGAKNKFSPLPIDRGQTTVFKPGRVVGAFRVSFNGSDLVWTLTGPDGVSRTATASSKCTRCVHYTLSVTKAGTGGGTVTSSPAGITCGATCSAVFVSGTVVTLTASPAGASTFTGWSGACTGTGTCTVTMNAAATVTAKFTKIRYTLNVTKAGTGGGTVTSSPAGITCGTTCSASFASGTVVTLTASPDGASTFTGWSGACTGTGSCSVTMSAAASVTATFTKIQYSLSVTKTGTGGGTVTSSPTGITCGTTCSALFTAGTVVTLTAIPDASSTFTGWSGACTGTGNCTVIMSAAASVTATFTKIQYALTVGKAGTGGGTIASSPTGIACGSTCSASFDTGTVVTLIATPDASSTFTGWSGACTGTGSCSVTMTAAQAVTATFAKIQYSLTITDTGTDGGAVTSSPAGITCGATCSASFDSGTVVTLSVASDGTSTFGGWGGACTGTGTCTVTMSTAQTVTATFTLIQYSLSATKTGTGGGIVTSSPAGITCGTTCSALFTAGTGVTLTATPDASSTFTGWSGACTGMGSCSVAINAPASVTATFTKIQYSLTVTESGTGGGIVTSSPAGITCGSTCSASFDSGTVVTLSVASDGASTFGGWNGVCSGTGSCSVTMSAAQTVTATFTRIQYSVSVTKGGTGGGTVTSSPAGITCGATCSALFTAGIGVTLTAMPDASSTFTGWSGACTGTGTCTVTMSAVQAVTATFTRIQYSLTVTENGLGGGAVTSSPAGIICGTTCSALFDAGTIVTLSVIVTPNPTSTFTGWSGACTGTDSCTVTMDAAKAVTATFATSQYPLSVTMTGTGGGTVTSSTAGITCGTICSALFDTGTLVTLAATSDATSTFTGWSGACTGTGTCTVTMNAVASVTATFARIQYTLSVVKAGSGSGVVTLLPAGITCEITCSNLYDSGTVVTLTVAPNASSTFTGWNGACTGTGACTVTMAAARSVTATFTLSSELGISLCAGDSVIRPESFHVFTMGPTGWVERGILHFPGNAFFTQTLDLAPYLPDAQGLYRVRLIHQGLGPARIDDLELLSGNAEKLPDSAVWVDTGRNFLPVLQLPSTVVTNYPDVVGGTIDVQWNAPPRGQDITLVLDAIEGGSCNEDLVVNLTPLPIGGKVSDPLATVMLNGHAISVDGDGNFGDLVDLQDGLNTMTATATNADGTVSTRTIQVTLDQTPPVITLSSTATVADPSQLITGTVDDPEVRLVTAEVTTPYQDLYYTLSVINGQFSLPVVLLPGENDLTFEASDSAGNIGSTSTLVTLDNPGLATLNGQVTDAIYGTVLTGAQVSVTDPQQTWEGVTDEFGEFAFPVAAGAYTTTIHMDGYADQQIVGTAEAGTTPSLNIHLVPLNPSPPQLSAITVSDVTDRSAVVHWSIDQPAVVTIADGPTTSYGSTMTIPLPDFAGQATSQLLEGLPQGTTIHYMITVTNTIGLSSSSGDLTFTTASPTLAIPSVNPFTPSLTRVRSATVTGTAPQGTQIQIYSNGMQKAVAPIAGGAFSTPINLTDGLNTIAARAVDGLGQVSPLSAPVSLTFDTTPPFITRLSFYFGSLDLLTSEVSLQGIANKPGTTVRLVIDGLMEAADQTVATDAGYFCFCHFFLQAGFHEFSFTLTDQAGNVSIPGLEVFDFTVHPLASNLGTGPPSATPLDPQLNPIDSPRAPGAIDIAGQAYASGPDSLFSVEVSLDGAVIGTVSTDVSGRFVLPGVALTIGTHLIEARQLPAPILQNGFTVTTNPSNPIQETIVVMDNPPPLPVVSVLVPADGGTTNVYELPIRGTISDPTAVLTTANGRLNAPGSITSGGGAFLSDSTVALHPGDNAIIVMARSSDGAQSSRTVHVSLHPLDPMPTMTVTDPLDGSTFTASPISVSGSVNPISGSDPIGFVVVEKAPLIATSGLFTASVNLAQRYHSPLVMVWAQDQAGRIGRGQIQAYYQPSLMPSVTITAPAPQAILTASPITVTGRFTNATSVSVNGIQVVLNSGTFTASGIVLTPGVNTVTAIATDAGGQQATMQVAVVFTPANAILTGTVADISSGLPITGATITVADSTTGGTTTVHTDATGHFTATIVPGDFDLMVTQPGYTSAAAHGTANGSQPVNLVFSLTPALSTGRVAGTVTDAATGLPLSQAIVSVVDAGSHLFSAQTGSNGGFAVTGLSAGAFTVTISRSGYAQLTGSGSLPSGGVAILNAALVPVATSNKPVPHVSALSPSDTPAGHGDVVITVSGRNFVRTSVIYFDGQELVTQYVSALQLVGIVPASLVTTIGNDPVTVWTPPPGGGLSNAIIFTVIPANPNPYMDLQISEPADGSTVTQSQIFVRGYVSTNLEEFGITVNGVVAQVEGGEFAANHVALAPGNNTITVVGTAVDGMHYQQTLSVISQPDPSYIELTASPESGVGPLTLTLTADTFLSAPVASAYLSYEAAATPTVTPVSATQYNVTLDAEGLYVFTLSVTDTQGRTYQDSVAVNVISLTAIDTLLKSKWEGMKTALVNKDISTAMGYLTEDIRPKYQQLFQRFGDNLPGIAASLPDLQLTKITGDVAEYYVVQLEGGTQKAHFIYFVKDENGFWKLASF